MIKNYYVFLILLFINFNSYSQKDCVVFVDASVVEFDANNYDIQPGDVICVETSSKTYLRFKNLVGTAQNPIIIQNVNGKVIIDSDHHFGIVLDNCKYVKFTGTGYAPEQYGFKIQNIQGNGFGVGAMSTNIEIEYVEITDILYVGLMAKTDPDCGFAATREKFTMYDLNIHNLKISNCGTEGMYIGSSKFTGQTLYDCDTIVFPHYIEGVKVFNNTIINTGWDGIQVSSSNKNCNIYGNTIMYDSDAGQETQMSGILIGGGSKCDCFNNKILEGKGSGIEIFGIGGMKIYNNLIVNPGKTFYPGDLSRSKYGVYIKDVENSTEFNSSINFYNNTIINPKSEGIHFRNNRTSGNKAYNNCIINPGNHITMGSAAYIRVEPDYIPMDMQNNYLSLDIEAPKFDDVINYNYDLSLYSPLINTGIDISAVGVQFDIKYRIRPYANAFDIGAYESNKNGISITENEEEISTFSIYPNPVKDYLRLEFELDTEKNISIKIINLQAITVFEKTIQGTEGSNIQSISLDNLSQGAYMVHIQSGNKAFYKKVIKVN